LETAEILILRHQVAVLQRRQARRPKLTWESVPGRAVTGHYTARPPRARVERMQGRVEPTPEVFGRDSELTALRGLVAADRRAGAVLLTGAAGIGKTALWEAGLEMARPAGRFVLAARPAGAEAGMAFAGLIDLCDRVGPEVLADLPAPQRSALEVALLRAEPLRGAAPGPHAIALAFLNVLRGMAAGQPLVVAVDDLPWLDPLSVSTLTFAARRLRAEPVAFLLARRPGSPSPLELVLAPERLEVGALDTNALRRLLASRLEMFPSRVLLRRIVDVSQGNALFALELGRSVRRGGVPAGNPDMILPASVEDALGARAVALIPGVRRLLLAVALTGGLTREMLEAVTGRATVDAAFDDGVLVREESRVRASHPLLAAAAVNQSGPQERRAVHVAIAGAVADEELSALHLALATDRPSDRLAARLTAAASRASSRGARPQAVVLAEHALRLTPAHAEERPERLLIVAAYLKLAGETQRLTDLLGPAIGGLPAGTARARAWLLLPLPRFCRQRDRPDPPRWRATSRRFRDPVDGLQRLGQPPQALQNTVGPAPSAGEFPSERVRDGAHGRKYSSSLASLASPGPGQPSWAWSAALSQ
jgi:hypothetical protein